MIFEEQDCKVENRDNNFVKFRRQRFELKHRRDYRTCEIRPSFGRPKESHFNFAKDLNLAKQ